MEETTTVRRAPGRSPGDPVALGCVRLAGGPRVIARLAPGIAPGDRVAVETADGVPVARPLR